MARTRSTTLATAAAVGSPARGRAGLREGRVTRQAQTLAATAAAMISIVLVVPAAISSAQATPVSPPAPAAARGGEHPQPGSSAPAWAGFAGNAQHTAQAPASPQPLSRIRWHTPVDLAPDLSSGELLIHYGSPMITAANTVVVPTRVSATAGFQVDAYAGATGARRWSVPTDYRAPTSSDDGQTWTPPLPATLTTGNTLAVAGAGATVLMRTNADDPTSTLRRRVFYGLAGWQTHRAQYNAAVQISTPLTAGPDGSVYFGFSVSGPTPANLSSGIARIDAAGHASWTSAATAAGDPAITDIALNAAPALSPHGTTVYTTVIGPSASVLVGLDADTLAPRYHATLTDPVSGQPAFISTSTSATPTIGPDGDVYYGILENPFPNHNERGWLLHYDATLTHAKIPGSFGWDNTVSILPASALPAYRGRSPYLVVSKYNNYLGLGPSGDGHNTIAVLDPRASAPDPYASVQVMKPVQTILSPVHFPGAPAGARYEWCINSAVVDPASGSVIANSEDGQVYRWDLVHHRLAETLRLNPPLPEAYTPTIIGPDGTVYAINNATLYAIGR